MYGVIRYVNVGRGYAFIAPDGTDVLSKAENVFLHYSNLVDKSLTFDLRLLGRRVLYDLSPACLLGKPPQAINCLVIAEEGDVRAGGVSALGGVK